MTTTCGIGRRRVRESDRHAANETTVTADAGDRRGWGMTMHMHEFKRDDGAEILVVYRYRHGSPDTYSPLYGTDGGDPDEIDYEQAECDDREFDLKLLTEAETERLDTEIHAKHVDDFGCDD